MQVMSFVRDNNKKKQKTSIVCVPRCPFTLSCVEEYDTCNFWTEHNLTSKMALKCENGQKIIFFYYSRRIYPYISANQQNIM